LLRRVFFWSPQTLCISLPLPLGEVSCVSMTERAVGYAPLCVPSHHSMTERAAGVFSLLTYRRLSNTIESHLVIEEKRMIVCLR
ncbi:MAG: hypothetical protein FWH14_08940, partial [Oscillospiraceae bacterium]|nr:hypothetical protein [Oscillospiraceae bacterium]